MNQCYQKGNLEACDAEEKTFEQFSYGIQALSTKLSSRDTRGRPAHAIVPGINECALLWIPTAQNRTVPCLTNVDRAYLESVRRFAMDSDSTKSHSAMDWIKGDLAT
ncbi:hypothetical protein T265_09628 [Opisthorchis viverrini]|uniref:Uncharacterized protein n=1 Tax=Opisthorchis viverrini TaxID=6198 RepID=A0A074Z9K2_OPIVI|nr:hypothetical protein T265_09628 [Opisthorchis viverrini]KER22237.1 hypothetical protein T265_09628 [Opisthorchis viverrini]